MGRNIHQNNFRERNAAPDRGHSWPVTHNGAAFGSVRLVKNMFEASAPDGSFVGRFDSLTSAFNALLGQR